MDSSLAQAQTVDLTTIPFDPSLYLLHNADVAAAGVDARTHWEEYGREEERRGDRKNWWAPHFDEQAYRSTYPDAAAMVAAGVYVSGAEHFLALGRAELKAGLRQPPADFSEAEYRARKPSVTSAIEAGTYLNGYDHWLQWGSHEDKIALMLRTQQGLPERQLAPFVATKPIPELSAEQKKFWAANGFLILEGAISQERCEAVNARIDRLWQERGEDSVPVSIDVYLERPDSRRIPMAEAPDDARDLPNKINDMGIFDDTVRSVALDEDVAAALRWVLQCDPALIGSLNFERGSTQRFHTDTLYMPGKTPGGMTAAWFALEDVSAEAGPLIYYPGSHLIPMFRFSSGDPAQIDAEVPYYVEYMDREVQRRGLSHQQFLPKQGDVLIWHELLYHGGAPIVDLQKTRKSLVVHYWRSEEAKPGELVAAGSSFYWNRAPLA